MVEKKAFFSSSSSLPIHYHFSLLTFVPNYILLFFIFFSLLKCTNRNIFQYSSVSYHACPSFPLLQASKFYLIYSKLTSCYFNVKRKIKKNHPRSSLLSPFYYQPEWLILLLFLLLHLPALTHPSPSSLPPVGRCKRQTRAAESDGWGREIKRENSAFIFHQTI